MYFGDFSGEVGCFRGVSDSYDNMRDMFDPILETFGTPRESARFENKSCATQKFIQMYDCSHLVDFNKFKFSVFGIEVLKFAWWPVRECCPEQVASSTAYS